MTSSSTSRPKSFISAHPDLASALFIVALSLIPRVLSLHPHALLNDEAQFLNLTIANNSPFSMISAIAADGNAPLPYLILKGWLLVFGNSAVSAKLLFFLFGLAIPSAIYACFHKYLTRRACLIAACLAALTPTLVLWGDVMRPYGLLTLLSLIALRLFADLIGNPSSVRLRVLYGLLLALMMYAHTSAAAICLSHALLIAFGMLRRWWSREHLAAFAVSIGLSLLLYIPGGIMALYGITHDAQPWATHLPWWVGCVVSPFLPFASLCLLEKSISSTGMVLVTVLYWTSFCYCALKMNKQSIGRYIVYVSLTLLFALALVLTVAFGRDRYMIVLAPACLLTISFALECLFAAGDKSYRVHIGVLAALVGLVWLPQLLNTSKIPASCVYDAISAINKNIDPARDAVLVTYPPFLPAAAESIGPGIKLYGCHEISPPRDFFLRWIGYRKYLQDHSLCAGVLSDAAGVLDSGGRIWVLTLVLPQGISSSCVQDEANLQNWLLSRLRESAQVKETYSLQGFEQDTQVLVFRHVTSTRREAPAGGARD